MHRLLRVLRALRDLRGPRGLRGLRTPRILRSLTGHSLPSVEESVATQLPRDFRAAASEDPLPRIGARDAASRVSLLAGRPSKFSETFVSRRTRLPSCEN